MWYDKSRARILRSAVVGVFLGSAVLIAWGIPSFGITWDEPRGYFQGAFRFLDWLKNPTQLSTYWPLLDPNKMQFNFFYFHPPITRMAGALTWTLFHPFFGTITSLRLAAALLMAGGGALIFYWMSKEAGLVAGGAAVVFFLSMPRVVGQGFILTSESSLLFFWILASWAYFYWRGHSRGHWLIGAVYGALLLTKFTGLLWIAPVFLFDVIIHKRIRFLFWVKVVLIAWVVAIAFNPTWWQNPITGIWHHHILPSLSRNARIPFWTLYWGKAGVPPFHYVITMILITTPVLTLFLAGAGIASTVRESARASLAFFSLLQLTVMLLIFSAGNAPKFDGVRLFIVVFPWIAILAGFGLVRLCAHFKRLRPEIVFVPLSAWLLLTAVRTHPYEFSYYNALVGGPTGARRLGFESTYFWEAVNPDFCKKINKALPVGATVQVFPVYPDHFAYLQFAGYLRKDLQFSGQDGEYFLLMARQGVFTPDVWDTYKHSQPILTADFRGVPLILIYKNH